jgi:hypothetical protein
MKCALFRSKTATCLEEVFPKNVEILDITESFQSSVLIGLKYTLKCSSLWEIITISSSSSGSK